MRRDRLVRLERLFRAGPATLEVHLLLGRIGSSERPAPGAVVMRPCPARAADPVHRTCVVATVPVQP